MTDISLPTQDVPLHLVAPNPWNPNEQTPRQYEAERESLIVHGFILPVILRPDPEQEGRYQIVDGEHRYNAMHEFKNEAPDKMHPQLRDLVERHAIPAVVLDLDDAQAKKLTLTLNETRGQANVAKRAELLAELSKEMELPDLLLALPWDEREMRDMLTVGEFDWDSLEAPDPDDFSGDGDKPKALTVTVAEEDEDLWRSVVDRWRVPLDAGGTDKLAATKALSHILRFIEEIPDP